MEEKHQYHLTTENIGFVLTEERPQEPSANATQRTREVYDRWIATNNKAKGYMFAIMSDTTRSKLEGKDTAFNVMDT